MILAHQGGWDEALLVLIPIGLFAAILALATRRAKRIQAERAETASERPVGDGSAD